MFRPDIWELVQRKRVEVLGWLRERRDLEEQHTQRLEALEWAILIFVIMSVIAEVLAMH
jgi:hypothetical protein